MSTITQASDARNNTQPLGVLAAQTTARAILEAGRKHLDKADILFLEVVRRHGRITPEGWDRLESIAYLAGDSA